MTTIKNLMVGFVVFFVFSSAFAFAKNIVVVGAGLSGLTAAHELEQGILEDPELKKQDWNIEIYEAKDRLGGRVFTRSLKGYPVEMGGENIRDGEEALSIRRMISKFNLKTHAYKIPSSQRFFFDQKADQAYSVYRDLMPAFPKYTPEDLKAELSHLQAKAENLSEVVLPFFNGLKKKTQDPVQIKKLEILQEMVIQWVQSYEGGSLEQLSPRYAQGSLLFILDRMLQGYQKSQGEDPRQSFFEMESVVGGNSRLIDALAAHLNKKVHLSSPLTQVEARDGHQDGPLMLQFERNPKIEADILVMTIPCPAYSKIQFGKNTVPPDVLGKIAKVGYGTHAKVILPHTYLGTEPTVSASNTAIWFTPEKGTLTLYLSSDSAWSGQFDEVSKRISLAENAFSKSGLKLTKDELAGHVPPVLWSKDPYTGGSYSYFPANLRSELEKTVKTEGEEVLPLFVPIDRRIYFAGEHTITNQDIRGTMEAAVQSGEKAARLILKRIKH